MLFLKRFSQIFLMLVLSMCVFAAVGTWQEPVTVPPAVNMPSSANAAVAAQSYGYYYTAPVSGSCTVGLVHKYYKTYPTIPGRKVMIFYHQNCN